MDDYYDEFGDDGDGRKSEWIVIEATLKDIKTES